LRAVDAVQHITKVLGKFGSVLAEFEWPVRPLRPWESHFGAAALGNTTDMMTPKKPRFT
jgi:hypothetical protein